MHGITTKRPTTTMARHHPNKRRTRTVATWALVLAALSSSSYSSPSSRRSFVTEAHLLRGPSASSGGRSSSSSSSAIQHSNRRLIQTEDVDANQNRVQLETASNAVGLGGDRDLARKNDGNNGKNNRGGGKRTKEEQERIKRENEERKKRNQQNRDRKKNRDSNTNNNNDNNKNKNKNNNNNNNDGQQKMKKEELKQYLDKMERKKNDEGKLTIKEMKQKKQQQLMKQKAEKLDKQEKKGKKKDNDKDEDEKLTKKEQKQQMPQMKLQNGQVKLNKQQKKDQQESKDDQEKLTKKELKEQKQQMKLQKEQAKLDKQEKKEKLQDKKDDQDKLTKQEKKQQMMVLQNANQEKLSKEELKELMKLTDNKFNFEHVGGSGGSKNDKDKDKDKDKDTNKDKPDKSDKPDKNNGSAASFALTDQLQAQSLQLDVDEEEEEDEEKKPKKDKDKNDKDKDKDENKPSKDMSASFTLTEEQPQAQSFQIQSIDYPEEDEDDSTPTYNTLNPNKVFLSTYPDKSTPLDSFEHSSTLQWNLGSSATAWSHVDNQVTPAYDGNVSIMSGLSSIKDLTQLEGEDGTKGKKVHSDLSLTTEQDFEGGVITFMVKWNMVMPNEAFYVMVDGQLALAPLAPADSSDDMEWIEYGVPVEEGQHLITWSHIYNPFGLDALPPRPKGLGDVPNLYLDDVRLYPFSEERVQGFEGDGNAKTSSLEMTTSGDATWIIQDGASSAGSYSIVASSDDISTSSGNADVSFVVASSLGGTLKYNILSSTTAPHDDFCILLNGEKADVVFGQSPTFESRRLDIPPGKVDVTLRHRKNPGDLSRMLLDTLGVVGTEGKTWLDDVRFEPRNN
mmetsp:Transcript_21780/g.45581  ORF Transcript_21780/g.45581 Transcript_21780/m.45581 type:complete len:845 (-) Transcript_21780:171-2705(-)